MTLTLRTPKVQAVVEDRIGWVIFNQPAKRNAISEDVWPAMGEAIAAFETDPSVRVIVLRGAGEEAFVSGGDISEFEGAFAGPVADERRASFQRAGDRALKTLRAATKPVIAMIHGFCFGGGVIVAQEADMLLASDDARFCIPAAKLGVGYPADAIARMTALIGPLAVADFMFSARVVDAAEAGAMGLVNAVLPKADLETQVRKLAGRIADNAPLTVAAAKAAIRASAEGALAERQTEIDGLVAACLRSDDFLEGSRAFMQKRRPAFTGT